MQSSQEPALQTPWLKEIPSLLQAQQNLTITKEKKLKLGNVIFKIKKTKPAMDRCGSQMFNFNTLYLNTPNSGTVMRSSRHILWKIKKNKLVLYVNDSHLRHLSTLSITL